MEADPVVRNRTTMNNLLYRSTYHRFRKGCQREVPGGPHLERLAKDGDPQVGDFVGNFPEFKMLGNYLRGGLHSTH